MVSEALKPSAPPADSETEAAPSVEASPPGATSELEDYLL
jgi:hypothetical protein